MTFRNKRAAILKDMKVGEISLVDEGDNPGAGVMIVKVRGAGSGAITIEKLNVDFTELAEAAGEIIDLAAGLGGSEGIETAARILKGTDMNIEELNAKLVEIEGNIDTVTKRAETAEAALAAMTAERDEAVAKAKDAKPADEDDEAVFKALPESIQKRIIDAEARANSAAEAVEKARDEAELATDIAKAKELGAADADAFGATLQRVRKGKTTDADVEVITAALAANAAVAKADARIFKAIGKVTGADATDVTKRIDAKIEEIRKAKPGLTREQAYAEALDADPSLYEAALATA